MTAEPKLGRPNKTGAERVADHNARLRDQGLKQVRSLWAHPDDHAAIRKKAADLLNARLKGKKRG